MPGPSGLDTVRSLRALDPAVGLVLVSGWGNEAVADLAEEGTVDIAVAKPLDLDKVRDLVSRAAALADGRRAGDDRP